MLGAGALRRIRNPEYTGENRCGACTVVNAVLVVAAGGLVAVASSVAAGAVVVLVGAVAIALRGYVVPGTPALTRHLPESVLAHFDHHEPSVPEGEEVPEEADLEAVLREAGAVSECEAVDDLCLEDDFGADWYGEIERIRESGDVEALVRDAIGDVEVRERDGALVAHRDGRVVGRWVSRNAAVADFAADRALADRLRGWETVPVDRRSVVTRGLRPFLDRCPGCGDHVTSEKVTSCCISGQARTVVHCSSCDADLFRSQPYNDLPESAVGEA